MALILPSGRYRGTVQGRIGVVLNRIWTGKYFFGYEFGDMVLNRIGNRWRWRIKGVCRADGDRVLIDYPQLGLTDILTPLSEDGSRWAGTMRILGGTVRFTLDDPTIRRCVGFARQWGYNPQLERSHTHD